MFRKVVIPKLSESLLRLDVLREEKVDCRTRGQQISRRTAGQRKAKEEDEISGGGPGHREKTGPPDEAREGKRFRIQRGRNRLQERQITGPAGPGTGARTVEGACRRPGGSGGPRRERDGKGGRGEERRPNCCKGRADGAAGLESSAGVGGEGGQGRRRGREARAPVFSGLPRGGETETEENRQRRREKERERPAKGGREEEEEKDGERSASCAWAAVREAERQHPSRDCLSGCARGRRAE
ncbi:hypothetical protein AXG93_4129s1080 [Marchantia polymorpha subsp. ruderalis]|uniref:Uncharacterized protein n=1 Tax=Marchantia polymorpha subsp. ruderalis TaxID=1480154 RepID=A0A176VER5_MARPO|nr:hypothetical protein AXG93_4129s1080 [Marchantia polymorpha subsp. ruderalis]